MCPCRFILVFFSAILAGYFAWKTVRSSPETGEIFSGSSKDDNQEFDFKRMAQNGFWVFIDMASGRYLWRDLRDLKKQD